MRHFNFYWMLFILHISCNGPTLKTENENVNLEVVIDRDTSKNDLPRIVYVAYGSFSGECASNCTRMYKHYLNGNTTTFWTDLSDSYFSDSGAQYTYKMDRASEQLSFDFIQHIPKEILKTKRTYNKIGCPDCNDGGGLYFEFKLDEWPSKPIVYLMEYHSDKDTGSIKILSDLIKSTLNKLEY